MKFYRVVIKSKRHDDVSFCFDDINDADYCYKKFLADLKENAINRKGDRICFEVYETKLVSTNGEKIQ